MAETQMQPHFPTSWRYSDAHGSFRVEAHPIADQEVSVEARSGKGVWCSRDVWARDEAEFLAFAIRRASLHPDRTYTYENRECKLIVEGRRIAGHEVSLRLHRNVWDPGHYNVTGVTVTTRSYGQHRALFIADAIGQALKVRIGRGW